MGGEGISGNGISRQYAGTQATNVRRRWLLACLGRECSCVDEARGARRSPSRQKRRGRGWACHALGGMPSAAAASRAGPAPPLLPVQSAFTRTGKRDIWGLLDDGAKSLTRSVWGALTGSRLE